MKVSRLFCHIFIRTNISSICSDDIPRTSSADFWGSVPVYPMFELSVFKAFNTQSPTPQLFASRLDFRQRPSNLFQGSSFVSYLNSLFQFLTVFSILCFEFCGREGGELGWNQVEDLSLVGSGPLGSVQKLEV